MIDNLALLATSATGVFAQTSSSDDGGGFGIIFLAAGFVFYGIIFFKYRNTNKRHHHESETEAKLHNMRADDQCVGSEKGLSNSKMRGANNNEVRGSVRKFF